MNKQDYKNTMANFVPDKNMQARIRQNVGLYAESQNAKHGMSFKKPVIALTFVCLLIFTTAFGFPLIQHMNGQTKQAKQEKPESNISTQAAEPARAFGGFVLTAYAANTSSEALTPDYKANATATELKPGVEVPMPQYSPLMSSVPGFPFIIGCNESSEQTVAADAIRIRTDKGSMLIWDTSSGKTEEKGKEFECAPGTTVYWSPLDSGDLADGDTVISFTALKAQQEIGTQKMIVKSLENAAYTVTLQ